MLVLALLLGETVCESSEISREMVLAAEQFLHLPIDSPEYHHCYDKSSEYSCEALLKAAGALEVYLTYLDSSKPNTYINVELGSDFFGDKLSKIFHAFLIGMISNRRVSIRRSDVPFQLPSAIVDTPSGFNGKELPSNQHLVCANLDPNMKNITLKSRIWPQFLYAHPAASQLLIERFEHHAAHFIGNYLFSEALSADCPKVEEPYVVEYVDRQFGSDASIGDYSGIIGRCGVSASKSHLIIKSNNQPSAGSFGSSSYAKDDKSDVCALEHMVNAKRLVQSYGSRTGWWAMALKGTPAGAVNFIEKVCFNVNESQRGSLWHTYYPHERLEAKDPYRINTWFFDCGQNTMALYDYVHTLI